MRPVVLLYNLSRGIPVRFAATYIMYIILPYIANARLTKIRRPPISRVVPVPAQSPPMPDLT
jgi:hypothetical protein